MMKLMMTGHSSLLVLGGGAFCDCGAHVCVTEMGCRAAVRKGDLHVADRCWLLSWRALGGFSHEARRTDGETIIHSMWRTGKEKNQWTFCNVAILPSEVAALVWEELAMRAFAHTQDPGD